MTWPWKLFDTTWSNHFKARWKLFEKNVKTRPFCWFNLSRFPGCWNKNRHFVLCNIFFGFYVESLKKTAPTKFFNYLEPIVLSNRLYKISADIYRIFEISVRRFHPNLLRLYENVCRTFTSRFLKNSFSSGDIWGQSDLFSRFPMTAFGERL